MGRRTPNEVEYTQQRLRAWIKRSHHPEMIQQAEGLPLRRDMVTLLTFVRDNKVIGTQSTGNMPLKMVREVTARFVKPPKLETTLGDQTYRIRSEADVWPLYYLHILAEVGGLLAIAPARRWRLTRPGQTFLEIAPLLQVSSLLTIWWNGVNWLVAYPFEGMGKALPPDFNRITLAEMRSLPVGRSVSFEKFAQGLIEKTGLTWTAPEVSSATMLLHGSIGRMVIDILAVFGVVKSEYQTEPLGKGTISKLAAFELRPFGQVLLEALAITND